jgi:hypothetical protein
MTVHSVQKTDWRDSFISAALYYGVFIWGFTESLSLFSLLNFTGILCGWICYDLVLLAFLICRQMQTDADRCKLYDYKDTKSCCLSQICSRLFHCFLINYSLCKDRLFKDWKFCFICFILTITFFIAIAYPPNNWDSLEYHLPRIEHWIQNGSLNHYYTSNIKQLIYAPFAEIVISHNRILTGDDWLMNVVQWFAFLGTIVVLSKVASLLGLSKKTQIATSLVFATLPMAILQSSSTQTDLVVTFWLVCLAQRFLQWKKSKDFRLSIEFGIALGLAILTKGTAYPIAFPFVIVFAILCLRQYKKYLIGGLCAALICLMLNMPHYIRNYRSFGDPIKTEAATKSSQITLESFFVGLFSNTYINAPIPLPMSTEINERLSNADKEIYPYGSISVYSFKDWIKNVWGIGSLIGSFHEDIAKNPLHMLLIMISFILIMFKRNLRNQLYIYLVLFAGIMFVLCIPWQPWVTRLQLPVFALSIPVYAILFDKLKYEKLKNVILLILCSYSLFFLFFNESRPLLYNSSIPFIRSLSDKSKTIWHSSREQLLFNNKPEVFDDYTQASDEVVKADVSNVGIILGPSSVEYPIWRHLRLNMKFMPKITYQRVNSVQPEVELIFVSNSVFLGETSDGNLYVFGRNKSDLGGWNILYPSVLH